VGFNSGHTQIDTSDRHSNSVDVTHLTGMTCAALAAAAAAVQVTLDVGKDCSAVTLRRPPAEIIGGKIDRPTDRNVLGPVYHYDGIFTLQKNNAYVRQMQQLF